MSTCTMAWRGARHTVAAAVCAGALAAGAVHAQAPLRVVPNVLVSIDQNRATIVDRIVAEWGERLASADAGITEAQLRATLTAMRADYLLAASVAGSLDGLRNVVVSSLAGAAPELGLRAHAKAIGDTADDLVYEPVTPCRVLDSRSAAGGVLQANQLRNWLAANPAGNFSAQGGAATNCGIPVKPAAVMINFTVANTTGTVNFLTAWPFGLARPNAATLNWTAAGQQIANAVIVPLCTGGGCASDFSTFASAQTDLIGDVLGYFAAPVATAMDCTTVASGSTAIPVSSDTAVALPACTAGYTRTGSACAGTSGVPSAYLLESTLSSCVFRNLSAVATYNATATSICCRIPGR